jgi:penicillin amidase
LEAQARAALAQTSGRFAVPGLKESVTVFRDRWGVPHIYAANRDDMFFAQGYVASQDRLFQMELWKREGQGRLAEIMGPGAVERDRFAHLVRYRGDLKREWASYGPDARAIAIAFTDGINAFIAQSHRTHHLPVEFDRAGFAPEPWTPEDLLSRVETANLSIGAARLAVMRARMVGAVGPRRAEALLPLDPPGSLTPTPGLDLSFFDARTAAALDAALNAAGGPVRFTDVTASAARGAVSDMGTETGGSNNWVAAGKRTRSGKPLLANDPHRAIGLPSNRYLVHLVCPGWNVIGATYPHLPGVQIGHNEHVAWGLTLTGPINADLYVEETDPTDSDRYRGGLDRWERMRTVTEKITVKGETTARTVTLRWTRHGPVLLDDPARHRVVSVRWAVSEPGTAAYLAAPALDRASDAAAFRKALGHWRAPAENFVYADVQGVIGFQVAGMVPVRRDGSSGLLPYPGGDGDHHEWSRFLAFDELPRVENPADGLLVTANNNILPPGYAQTFSANFAPPDRAARIRHLLDSSVNDLTLDDFARVQNDHLSPYFSRVRPALEAVQTPEPKASRARAMLLAWDGRQEKDSAPAALLFLTFARITPALVVPALDPETGIRAVPAAWVPLSVIDALTGPARREDWGADPESKRAVVLERALTAAWDLAEKTLGPAPSAWALGKVQAVPFVHSLSVPSGKAFDLPSAPKGGGTGTVDPLTMTPEGAASGASFRQLIDLSDWDASRAVNTPGQSGQPFSPHYADLLPIWAEGKYFPLLFTRAKIEAAGSDQMELVPAESSKVFTVGMV